MKLSILALFAAGLAQIVPANAEKRDTVAAPVDRFRIKRAYVEKRAVDVVKPIHPEIITLNFTVQAPDGLKWETTIRGPAGCYPVYGDKIVEINSMSDHYSPLFFSEPGCDPKLNVPNDWNGTRAKTVIKSIAFVDDWCNMSKPPNNCDAIAEEKRREKGLGR